jgi:GNAT superfamily N-acetyltransferase
VTPTRIRAGQPEDLEAVVRCHLACWREAYTGLVAQSYLDDPMLPARRTARWRQRLAGGRSVALAVTGDPATGEEVVGVVTWGPSRDPVPEPPLELMSLYVRAGHHGTGLAGRLLAAAIGRASASLWVYEANPRARAFYTRHGFRADGSRARDEDTGLWELRMVRAGP